VNLTKVGVMSFIQDNESEILKIKCPKSLDAAAATDFSNLSKSWMLTSSKYCIFDFTGVENITKEFYKVFIHFKTTLKKDNKAIYSLNLNPALVKQIREHGVEQAFQYVKSLNDIHIMEKENQAQGNEINVNFINPFLSAAQKTLEIQCQTPIKVLKPFLKKEQLPNIAIAGVLSLVSNDFSGNIVLCFPQVVFLKIYENMFGEKHETISSEIEDAASELLNIIYGMAKIELNTKGYNFQKALPTILTGDKIKIRQSGLKPAVVVPFETGSGQFHIEIEFSKTVEELNV
jgi:chemotaxis protein CheX